MQKIICFPDIHAINVDSQAFGCAMNAAAGWLDSKSLFIQLGDLVDGEALSAHERSRGQAWSFREELGIARRLVREMSSLAPKEKHITLGNHDDWFDRYLARKAPALEDLEELSLVQLLGFPKLGWSVTQWGDALTIGDTAISHEFGSAGGNAHQKAVQTNMASIVIGHTHRLALFTRKTRTGKVLRGVMSGWLGKTEGIKYRHRVLAETEWCHGFVSGWMERDGTCHWQPIPIENGRCVLDGKVYRA